MFFYNSRHDRRYPVSEIKSIGPYTRGSERENEYLAVAHMKNDTEVVIYESAAAALTPEGVFIAVIPAAPGYSLLGVDVTEEPVWLTRTPIIAWYAVSDGRLVPATAAGTWDASTAYAPVEYPDGRIWDAGHEVEHADAAEMVAYRLRLKEKEVASAASAEPSA